MLFYLNNFYVQLLSIGLVLFLIYQISPESVNEKEIEIDERVMEGLARKYNGDSLTKKKDLKKWVKAYLREEVFYQNAVELGLEKNDEIIKRMLVSKYNFLMNEDVKAKNVDERTLKQYYLKNKNLYWKDPTVSLHQILYRHDKHDNPKEELLELKSKLTNAKADLYSHLEYGDDFVYPKSLQDKSIDDIGKMFGSSLAKKLTTLPLEKWSEPTLSGMGYHLIWIENVKQNEVEDFKTVLPKVESDYKIELNRAYEDSIFKDNLKNYKVNYSNDVKKMLK